MLRNAKTFSLAAAVFALLLLGQSNSRAEVFFAYVSNSGNDANDCGNLSTGQSTSAPCKLFRTALSKMYDGGSITCMDVGGFASVTITKSVTIDCSAGGGSSISFIKIDAPGKVVTIRNLGFLGAMINATGIEIISAADVVLDNVQVVGFTGIGIYDRRVGPGTLTIRNSVVSNNAGAGIVIAPQSGSGISVVLENVSSRSNRYGLAVGIGGRVLARSSTFSGNANSGVSIDNGAIAELEDVLLAMNPIGAIASPGSVLSLSNSRINSNNSGISGTTTSYGNNKFFANALGDGTTPAPASLR